MTNPPERQDAAANFPNVGQWVVTAFPPGWMYVSGFGIRQMSPQTVTGLPAVPANVGLGQDALEPPETLEQYIGRQAKMIQDYLTEVKLAGPQLMAFHGAEEGFLLIARHTPKGFVSMLQAQTYVRVGNWVGIVTFTTPESGLRAARGDYDAFVKGLRILPPETPASPPQLSQ